MLLNLTPDLINLFYVKKSYLKKFFWIGAETIPNNFCSYLYFMCWQMVFVVFRSVPVCWLRFGCIRINRAELAMDLNYCSTTKLQPIYIALEFIHYGIGNKFGGDLNFCR